MFRKKGVFRNFGKFTGKHFNKVSFLIKLQACNFCKKETLPQVFSYEFCKISENIFSYRTPPVAASGLTLVEISLFEVLFLATSRKYCMHTKKLKNDENKIKQNKKAKK